MAEGRGKFKPIKAVGRVRTEENREERMREGLDAHLDKIAGHLDKDKVKQYMALFKYARENWDRTPREQKEAMRKDREMHGFREDESQTTDGMIDGIDVQALIRELKAKAVGNMEKKTNAPPTPEEQSAYDAIMGVRPSNNTVPLDALPKPPTDEEMEALLRQLFNLKEGQKPGESELG